MMTHIIGWGEGTDERALRLDTRKRRQLRNEVRPERRIESLRDGVAIIQANYPEVTLVSATAAYNCFGLVFASRRTWLLDETEALKALHDDGFTKLPWDPRLWEPGDVVLYVGRDEEICHVGVIASKRQDTATGELYIAVVSAWGESGEYLHPLDHGHPLLGNPDAVYSQRKSV